MEWLFFQSQSHRPAHVRREVFTAPSPHPEIQLWGPCHSAKKEDNSLYSKERKAYNCPLKTEVGRDVTS